jgi:hypothetical protein
LLLRLQLLQKARRQLVLLLRVLLVPLLASALLSVSSG